MKTRKRVTMLVTVSAPKNMPTSDVRREVKTLITHQCNYLAEAEDIKAIKVQPHRAE